jgi:hypothetical protein
MSNTQTLELRTLEDEELLDVVGGCGRCDDHCRPQCYQPRCYPQPEHCGPCGGPEFVVLIGVVL